MGRLLRRLRKARRGRGPVPGTVGAGLCAALVLALPGAAVAATAGDGAPYVFAEGAQTVAAAGGSAGAAQLKAGETYRSSLAAGDGAAAHYRVELDGAATAYASVVAVPPQGAGVKAAAADGITVSLRDRLGNQCDQGRAKFRSGAYPRPIAVAVERSVRPGGLRCQSAGTYYVVVERETAAGSSERDWGLELRVATEPGLVSAAPSAGARSWPSQPAPLPSGAGEPRSGGTGFNDARALASGAWQDRLRPGQSHFYRVPVDWGQQLFAEAELAGVARDERRGAVAGALDMELYNPARAPVAVKGAAYSGAAVSSAFDPLPPVAYENRLLSRKDEAAMRVAGWYWLKVTLDPALEKFGGGSFGVTLRVAVDGEAKQAPDYVRDPGEFQVSSADLAAAERGEGGAEWDDGAAAEGKAGVPEGDVRSEAGPAGGRGGASGDASAASAASSGDGAMTLVGVAGVGTGSALVLWLGAWRLVAVRRFRRVQG
ncbi:hypothetical protein ACYBSK_00060 [Streptomyces sp. BYX5S]